MVEIESYAINKRNILVVEGKDEELFFMALLRTIQISTIQVLPIGGKTQFKIKLQLLKSSPNFHIVQSIGIIRDCDANRRGAFDSVCSAVRSASLPVPQQPITPTTETPHISILVMPPEPMGSDHMLEDLCLESVSDDVATQCINHYFECLEEQMISLRPNVIAKARLHTFLASRHDPDLRLGEAAQAGYWNWDHPVFNDVKDFLHQLAVESSA